MRPAQVLVINLDARPDRLEAFTARWRHAAGYARFERFPAIGDPDRPALGCWRSHVAALRAAAAGGGPALILEDDAVFRGFTLDLPQPPDGWWLLRLGGWLRAPAVPLPYPSPWVPVARIAHTHAYVAADPGALAERIEGNARRDVGMALSFGPPGHYRLRTATVGQGAGRSDLTGIDRPADEFWD